MAIAENVLNEIVELGKKLSSTGLAAGTGGNLSAYDRESGVMAISPSGMDYFDVKPENIILMDLDGNYIGGVGKPSSEWIIHASLYRHRSDIGGCVHTHSVFATTLACLGKEIPATHYLIGFCGDKVPVAPYATPGSSLLAENIVKTIGDRNAVLMANHGVICVGNTLSRAFFVAEMTEFIAKIHYHTCALGSPAVLDEREMQDLFEKFKHYGPGSEE